MTTKIGTKPVYAASGYRFEITSGGITTIYDSAVYNFKLYQTGVVLAYNTTYAIRVAALVNGIYGNYGASCKVTTPAASPIPTKQLTNADCGRLVMGPSEAVSGATRYVFESTDNTGTVITYPTTANWFTFGTIFPIVPQFTYYTIRIVAFVGGVPGSYGSS